MSSADGLPVTCIIFHRVKFTSKTLKNCLYARTSMILSSWFIVEVPGNIGFLEEKKSLSKKERQGCVFPVLFQSHIPSEKFT